MKYLSIKTLSKLALIGVSLCLEGLLRIRIFLLLLLLWFFSFFCGIVKLICELRHNFFINLLLQQINNLWPSALFLRNLHPAAGKFTHSAVCGTTYTPLYIKNDRLYLGKSQKGRCFRSALASLIPNLIEPVVKLFGRKKLKRKKM